MLYVPKGKNVPYKHLYNSWQYNNDGIGVMHSENGKLQVFKELKSFNTFYNYYKSIEGKHNIALHFRIGTSGTDENLNLHPFRVNDNCHLMHNGILAINVSKNSKINDTQIFINDGLKGLRPDFYKDKSILSLIESIIGANNKFLIMDNAGKVYFVNEKSGHWKKGIWYSNSTYAYSFKDDFCFQPSLFPAKTKYERKEIAYFDDEEERELNQEGKEYCDFCGQIEYNTQEKYCELCGSEPKSYINF